MSLISSEGSAKTDIQFTVIQKLRSVICSNHHKGGIRIAEFCQNPQNNIATVLVKDKSANHASGMYSGYSDTFQIIVKKNKHQVPVSGHIDFIENFPSKYVNPRNIEIWLPEGFSKDRKYSVIYAHDGQMLFDKSKSWNNQSWDIDDVATSLIAEGKIRECIVVGIWNDGQNRLRDYFPQLPFESLTEAERSYINKQIIEKLHYTTGFQPNSDQYLKFIVAELKPFIDRHYPSLPEPGNTVIMGSSMGGLISLYAITRYPEIFGKAVCMSTHWPGISGLKNNPIPEAFVKYADEHFGNLKKHKIYFDLGDQGLDSFYAVTQVKVDNLLLKHGFDESDSMTIYAEGDDHTETYWNKRLPGALEFIMN